MRVLIYIIPLAITIYALFDCASTPQEVVRNIPKWGWLVIIILFATLGSIGWFIAGRPKKSPGYGPRRGRIVPPDDDPDFLKNL
ncbi:MAG: PLD nuclease N-terminal domain-containing protein [Actinomycetes bacterium]